MKTWFTNNYFVMISIVILSIFMTGCNITSDSEIQFDSTEIVQFENTNSTLKYNHYYPDEASTIQLEFEYPDYWYFTPENYDFGPEYTTIFFDDPKFKTLPKERPDDFGSVVIMSYQSDVQKPISERIKNLKLKCQKSSGMSFDKEYDFMIDGTKAFVIECQIVPTDENKYTVSLFQRQIYFENDGKDFWILIMIPEKERNEDFEIGSDHLIKSMKFVD